MTVDIKLDIVKTLVTSHSAALAVNNILTKKKLTDVEKNGIRTLLIDLFFSIRENAKKDSFDNGTRQEIWAALLHMKKVQVLKFVAPEIGKAMAGFRPGVLQVEEEEEGSIDDLISGNASDVGDDGGEVDEEEVIDEGGEASASSSFRDIQGGGTGSKQVGQYLNCPDAHVDESDGEASQPPKAPKRKGQQAASRQSSSKKPREGSPDSMSAPGKSRLHSAPFTKYQLCLELSDTKTLYLGKHPELQNEAEARNKAMQPGRTPLRISDNTIALISKWENREKGENGKILTLLSHDELYNLSRAGLLLGGIQRGSIEPAKRSDGKSIEAAVLGCGFSKNFIDDIFLSHGIYLKSIFSNVLISDILAGILKEKK